jgi:hypothetical protein
LKCFCYNEFIYVYLQKMDKSSKVLSYSEHVAGIIASSDLSEQQQKENVINLNNDDEHQMDNVAANASSTMHTSIDFYRHVCCLFVVVVLILIFISFIRHYVLHRMMQNVLMLLTLNNYTMLVGIIN